MIRAIAIDSDENSLVVLKNLCSTSEGINLEKTFTSYEKALKHIRKFPVDLVFVDIAMCIQSGRKITQNQEQQKAIIFTSSDLTLATEAFDMNAIDYLMKPFSVNRFEMAVSKAQKYTNFLQNKVSQVQEEKLCVRADYSLKILKPSEILFLESLGDYVTIFLENQKKVITKTTMTEIHTKLNQKEFIRVNRSYIIPFSRIEHFGKRIISIAGKEIAIGDTYRKQISNLLLAKANY
ncbi:MAG: LytTR family DNA-binding domain-containing protein [Bacteroidota bacterium]